MPAVTTIDEMEMDVVFENESSLQSLKSGRSAEEIEEILVAAKLDRLDLQPVSQEILFDSKFSTTEFRYIQLDKDMLQTIEVGQVLVFRGDEHDAAVLCTDSETFEIKEAETTNSLLVFKDLQMPDVKSPTGSTGSSKSPGSSANTSLNTSDLNDSTIQDENLLPTPAVKSRMIIDVAHSYLEVKRMRPNMSKIRRLLRGSEYDGKTSMEERRHESSVTLNMLLEKVPASREEIVKHLEEIRVVDINGNLRLVESDYLFRIFSQVLNCVDENSWSSTQIEKDVVVATLSSLVLPFFVEKVFEWFFVPFEEAGASSSKVKYTYQENTVCRFVGETLLKSMGKFNLREFMKVWQESVPEGLKVSPNQLSGIAVYDEDCSPPVIWHFPEDNLPETFTDRLALLFETKARWKLNEISPFTEVFSPPSQNVGNLLTKYARSTTVNGVKYYFSKHGK
ncbi:Sister chromatid cohesion protein DCC1 [Orchesella cincta]|uniref:Sister chromatid cohesion protein DCC1 n=1 Tax=Orchesella cincta TaxID=48709 RepID=A0A1D2NG01_ORCCI|nr:Sister chromatid cohesion protein DCC1 [Orchesella cincta]